MTGEDGSAQGNPELDPKSGDSTGGESEPRSVFVARRARVVVVVMLAPVVLVLILTFGSVILSDHQINRAVFGIVVGPFVAIPTAIVIRALLALDLSIDGDELTYRTIFRSQVFERAAIEGCSTKELSNGISMSICPYLRLEDGSEVSLKVFNSPKSGSQAEPNPKAVLAMTRLVDVIQSWIEQR